MPWFHFHSFHLVLSNSYIHNETEQNIYIIFCQLFVFLLYVLLFCVCKILLNSSIYLTLSVFYSNKYTCSTTFPFVALPNLILRFILHVHVFQLGEKIESVQLPQQDVPLHFVSEIRCI